MSINLVIIANTFSIKTTSKGKKVKVRTSDYFNTVQTPTNVTYEILKSKSPIDAYITWIEGLDVYWGQEHIDEFRSWINLHGVSNIYFMSM